MNKLKFSMKATNRGDNQTILGDEEFMSLDLENFCIYRPLKTRIHSNHKKKNTGEMVQLNEITGQNNSLFYFDGTISYGKIRRYVQRIPFEILSIGGYENTSLHTVGDSLWIQSKIGETLGIWYCLRRPAFEYRRLYEPFVWIADFAKHLVDYMHHHKQVALAHLTRGFHQWLQKIHGMEECFQQWLRKKKGNDFRGMAASHASFLLYQAVQLDMTYARHPLWDEINPGALNAIPLQARQPEEELESIHKFGGFSIEHKTVVTPYVYESFKHLLFAKCFEVVQGPRIKIKKSSDLVNGASFCTTSRREQTTDQDSVCIGDVVAVKSDAKTTWKTNDKMWYGYVQSTKHTKLGEKLNLIWLYRPSDTPCQDMRYPYSKELFLSDHCNCGDDSIYAHEVTFKPRVAFFEGPDFDDKDFFVRQKYVGNDSAWVTLKKSDFRCDCGVETLGCDYNIGDTFLVARAILRTQQVLEPVILVEKAPDGLKHYVRVRLLQRLGRVVDGDIHVEPNELIYTSSLEDIPIVDIHRSCHIRFYTKEERDQGNIPAPYCRQGTADCFFITHQLSSDDDQVLKPLTRPWPYMNQGWDPSSATCQPKLKGLDIFCGGGNLGRGLEEGGAVKFKWAVDYFKEAIHTYKANMPEADGTKLFYGSVNDFLRQAIEGRGSKLIAQAGEVEVISAGSPCQGFSSANQNKGNDRSLLNVSMVASVVSYVDFYRPKYAFLENVLGMAKCGVNGKRENVFAQVICALVGLGYQVRPSTLDAWSFGSPQSRTRLFISITEPGLTPPPDPPQSHSHPDGISGRSLGKTANGLPLGSRYWDLTPFEYVTIGEATKDLPVNPDGKTTCIPFSDHRVTRHLSVLNYVKVSCVPRFPRGMSFSKAVLRGLMPPPQMEGLGSTNKIRTRELSRSWQRVNPEALIPTVTTCCQPEDGISGSWVHWDENRVISVMEVRRAQGIPDHEVIIGSPAMQWKIIGNSVARPVALALGMSLRAAWVADGSRAPPQSKYLLESTIGMLSQAVAKSQAIVNASKITEDRLSETNTSPTVSNSLKRTTRHTTNRSNSDSSLAKSSPPPVRTPGFRLISSPLLEARSEPRPEKRKLQTSVPKFRLFPRFPRALVTISSGSESEILRG